MGFWSRGGGGEGADDARQEGAPMPEMSASPSGADAPRPAAPPARMTFDSSSGGGAPGGGGAGGRLYNPYEGIHAGLSQNAMRSVYIPEAPEQLFAEEAVVDRRSWAENVTYLTGVGYLGGTVAGGAAGLLQKFRDVPPGPEILRHRRLLANWAINGVMKAGPAYGNAFGVLGFYYANIESGLHWYRGEDDMWNSIAAGVATGALFRSNAGLRVAAASGVYGCAFALACVASRQWSLQFS